MDVDTLIAHLERAPRHNDYIHALDDQKQTLSTIYNNMPWPMLILNANMIALNTNKAARQFVDSSAPIILSSNGSLHVEDKALHAAFLSSQYN